MGAVPILDIMIIKQLSEEVKTENYNYLAMTEKKSKQGNKFQTKGTRVEGPQTRKSIIYYVLQELTEGQCVWNGVSKEEV